MRLNANNCLPCLCNSRACRSRVITCCTPTYKQNKTQSQTFPLLQWLTALLFKSEQNQFKHTPVIMKNATSALVPKYHTMKVMLHTFLILAQDSGEGSASCSTQRAHSTNLTGDWLGPRVSLCMMTKREAPYREPNPVVKLMSKYSAGTKCAVPHLHVTSVSCPTGTWRLLPRG
jgi:hypothetical protein